MCSWWMLYTLIPIFIGISLTQYKSDILKLVRHQIFSSEDAHKWDVVVYIPSARNHFKERQTIRKTWWHHVEKNVSLSSRVTIKFAVGKQACLINGKDTKDDFSCEEWHWPALSQINNKTRTAISIQLMDETDDNQEPVYSVQSLKFIVHHPIILKKLGIHDSCRSSKAVVRLREATTSKDIVDASFDAKPQAENSWKLSGKDRTERFHYKTIDPPYVLPKGFRGEVILDNLESGNSKCNFVNWNYPWKTSLNLHDVIEFLEEKIPLGFHSDEDAWKNRPVHLFDFSFVIHDRKELKKKIKNKSKRQEELMQNVTKESEALDRESEVHRDLVFVDGVDVYRNLPQKFLQFSSWISANMNFKFLLKADDDCYLDVEKILHRLDGLPSSNNTWLGRFRYNWRLDKYGKWAESLYTASTYPRFACGSGYALSRDLVEWLSKNSEWLRCYQGEDTSLGIWMSAIDPVIVDEPLWLCEKECLSDMYSMPDLRPEEMVKYWSQRVECSDPCGCD